MKTRTFIIALAASMLSIAAFAQNGHEARQNRRQFSPENYKQKLEAFVTKQAGLTEEEGKNLFPLLHEMLEAQRKNNEAARKALQACNANSSEADYEKALKQSLTTEVENKKLEETYYLKFHNFLTWQKVSAVRIALHKFQMEALRKFSPQGQGQKKGQGPQQRRRGHNQPRPQRAQTAEPATQQ